MDPFKTALLNMASPQEKGVICLDITNRCDLKCSNCTRLLQNQLGIWDMTVDNFKIALQSLHDWDGVIAIIGGNPCAHPNFEELAIIFADLIPETGRRGVWTNNGLGKERIVAEYFGYWNLNTHGKKKAADSLIPISQEKNWPIFLGTSDHAPLLTAIKDFVTDEAKMWEIISTCEINKGWSAAIVQNKGVLRGYFCEVAASFDLARGEDHGFEIKDGWWKEHVTKFSEQVKHFCPGCGASLNLQSLKDYEETDQYSKSNIDLVKNSERKGRSVLEISPDNMLSSNIHNLTSYTENHIINHG